MLIVLAAGCAESAPDDASAIRTVHTVAIEDPKRGIFQITSRFSGLTGNVLEVALPRWTPGYYTLVSYGNGIRKMRATDAAGRPIPMRTVDVQRWRLELGDRSEATVEFQVAGDVLALNRPRITDEWAVFTGTQTFLQPIGYADAGSSLRLRLPADWKVATPLEHVDGGLFRAANYHELVDTPFFLGSFDRKDFTIDGKPHFIAAVPRGTLSDPQLDTIAEVAALVAETQKAVFGDSLPYDRYGYMWVFASPEEGLGGGLEHASSFLALSGRWQPSWSARGLGYLIAHEYFHLWNPKRLRPIGMHPYDYQEENPSPLLWMAEGVTSYYTILTLLRAGEWDRQQFLDVWPRLIEAVEINPARPTLSMTDASVSTWRNFDVPSAELFSYYPAGQVMGALLDLMILDDTNGRYGLDTVLGRLWDETGPAGLAYDMGELLAAILEVTGRDYGSFFERHVFGTEPPTYAEIFAPAGYDLAVRRDSTGDIGAGLRRLEGGAYEVRWTWRGSPARAAGLENGDIIVSLENGERYDPLALAAYIGERVTLNVRRDGSVMSVPVWIERGTAVEVRLAPMSDVDERQMRIREAWLGAGDIAP